MIISTASRDRRRISTSEQRAKLQPRSVMKSYPVNATCNRYIYGWALGAGLTPGVHRVAPPLSLLYLLTCVSAVGDERGAEAGEEAGVCCRRPSYPAATRGRRWRLSTSGRPQAGRRTPLWGACPRPCRRRQAPRRAAAPPPRRRRCPCARRSRSARAPG